MSIQCLALQPCLDRIYWPLSILLPLYCTELNTAKYNLVWNGTPMLPYILFLPLCFALHCFSLKK